MVSSGHAPVLSLDEWLENPAAADLDVRVHLLAADVVRTNREDLIADVSRTFQTLYPLVLAATSAEPLSAIRAFLEPKADTALERRPEHSLDSMAAETLVPKDELERSENSLDRKKQIIFYGPPGTGKTFLARKLAKHVVAGAPTDSPNWSSSTSERKADSTTVS
jgi:5-methylcytosine-specific restriction protein B